MSFLRDFETAFTGRYSESSRCALLSSPLGSAAAGRSGLAANADSVALLKVDTTFSPTRIPHTSALGCKAARNVVKLGDV